MRPNANFVKIRGRGSCCFALSIARKHNSIVKASRIYFWELYGSSGFKDSVNKDKQEFFSKNLHQTLVVESCEILMKIR